MRGRSRGSTGISYSNASETLPAVISIEPALQVREVGARFNARVVILAIPGAALLGWSCVLLARDPRRPAHAPVAR
jgi:hypothetical protein